jgi:predicted transcriptional regulator
MTTKELLRKLLDRLPDDATFEDVQYQIYVLQKIRAGEEDLEAGRTIPHEQVLKDLAQWLK